MRSIVLSLIALGALGTAAGAEPAPVLSFGMLVASAPDARVDSPSGFIASSDRDIATLVIAPEVRPLRRPAAGAVRQVAAVPASSVQRKITRFPWITGVYQ